MYKLRSIFNWIFPSAPKLNTFEITFDHLETSAFLLLIQFFSCRAFVSFVLMKCLSKCPYSNKSYIVWRGGLRSPLSDQTPPFQFRTPSNSGLQGPPFEPLNIIDNPTPPWTSPLFIFFSNPVKIPDKHKNKLMWQSTLFFYKHTGKLGWSSICLRFFQFESEITLDSTLNFQTHFMVWYCVWYEHCNGL